MKGYVIILFGFGLIGLSACQSDAPAPAEKVTLPVANKANYWYQGKAEISSYSVTQERYGELREGGQVMVFVSEDFSAKKQVKLDAEPAADDARVPILKLNTIRRFQTGIYDYTLMQSVFTGMDIGAGRTLKTTTTVQDWCGHVFTQFNAEKDGYRVRSFSYFESEGDADILVKPALLEDELWTLLRLKPFTLASAEVLVQPSVFYTRLKHKPVQPEKARISIEKGETESILNLVYTSIPRELGIRFETEFPHRILGWAETHEGELLSKGTLKKIMLDDYWKHHDNASAPLRTELNPGF